jgi:hypothetical protein
MRHRLLRRARRGQSAVLVALVLFAMLLLVAMSTNIGIAVNDKVRMQSTADLSTYAAAYHEAASLNELVELNKGIVDAVKDCRRILTAGLGVPGTWPETTPCGCRPQSVIAENAVRLCEANIDIAIGRFVERAQYDRTVAPALRAGEATADANFRGVDVDFFSSFLGSPTMRGTYWIRGGFNTGGMNVMLPSIADFRQVTDTALNYLVFVTCPMPPAGECLPVPPMLGRTEYVKSWFYKETRDPDVWVAGRVSGTPEKQYLDTDYSSGGDRGYFGASSTGGDDKIFAYSVAKPYDGSVGPSELSGTQRNGNGAPSVLGVYSARGAGYPELSMYDEYRARLVGINENLEGSRTPPDLIMEDGLRNGKLWNPTRFKH